jgi:hypothetical protein
MEKGQTPAGKVIAAVIVTIPGMTTGHNYPISTPLEGTQDQVGAYTAAAGNTNNANTGRVRQAVGSSQVPPGIAAPVAAKCHN